MLLPVTVDDLSLIQQLPIFPIMYGGLIELLQGLPMFVRSCDWKDWIADIIGTFVGILLATLWKQMLLTQTKN